VGEALRGDRICLCSIQQIAADWVLLAYSSRSCSGAEQPHGT